MEKNYKYNCDECRFHCNEEIRWKKHIITELHKTGKRKQRSDYAGPYECDICEYKTQNATTFKQHKLNEHADKETREKEFKYYCKICDYGTFAKQLIEKHNGSEKHIRREKYIK